MKVVIVGGVAAGAGTAARLRRIDERADIVIFEKGEYISYAACGLPYFIGDTITDGTRLLLYTPQGFKKRYNADVRTLSEVISVSSEEKLVRVKDVKTGTVYAEPYDVLVLAPGAAPVIPPAAGTGLPHVFTVRTVNDSLKIKDFISARKPERACVIGGGYIGIEMAENLGKLGIQVTIVEKSSHLIPSLDDDMCHDLHNYLREEKVRLYLSGSVTEITSDSVLLSHGQRIPSDMVLLCAGVRPDTAFLKESGIALWENGAILVDEYMRTSVPDVFAAGDAVVLRSVVTGAPAYVPLAVPAHRQALVVAGNVASGSVPTEKYGGASQTGILKAFDMTVASTGASERTLKSLGLPYLKSFASAGSHASYYPGATNMFIKLLFSRSGRILGAQITGYDAVDKIVDVLSAAIRMKCTIGDICEFESAYAPPYSTAKDPVHISGLVAEHVLKRSDEVFYLEDVESLSGDDCIVDIRTADEYRWGHLNGARSMTLDMIRENMDTFDKNKVIYVYCQNGQRGNVAVQILLQNGFKAKNLCGGYRLYQAMRTDMNARMATQDV